MFFAQSPNIVSLHLRESRHVDVANAAVRPVRFGARPAHDLDAFKSFRVRDGEDFIERKIFEYSAYESKLHNCYLLDSACILSPLQYFRRFLTRLRCTGGENFANMFGVRGQIRASGSR